MPLISVLLIFTSLYQCHWMNPLAFLLAFWSSTVVSYLEPMIFSYCQKQLNINLTLFPTCANSSLRIVPCMCSEGLIAGAVAFDSNAPWNPLNHASSGNFLVWGFYFCCLLGFELYVLVSALSSVKWQNNYNNAPFSYTGEKKLGSYHVILLTLY